MYDRELVFSREGRWWEASICIHTLDKDYWQTEMILNQSLQLDETAILTA